MTVSHLQNYTLMDILVSSQFYENIIAARDLTYNSGHESSFCVWGDARRYTLTIPREERTKSCMEGGKENCGDYSTKGYGLYTPKNKSRLIDLHYPHKDNMVIPSQRDLVNQLEVLAQNFELHPSSKYFDDLVSIVAHHSPANNIIKLFFGQYDVSDDIPEEGLPLSLNRLLNKEIGKSGYIPHRLATVLQSTGKYRAEVISFKNRSEYFSGLRKLKEWSF
ncbi:MAG TPA: hypothetical protein VJA23_01330 [Candidatus Nanoarchaeia archaeon]|nr:hypothetical protein [Candidatus Nanoarchaeia archaeon]